MKIAQVCPYNILRPGGVQTHIENLSERLKRRGHDVKIIAPGIKNESDNKKYIFIGKCREVSFNKTRFEISMSIGKVVDPIKEILERENFDVIHFHEPWVPALPLQILYNSKSASVATFHAATTNTFFNHSVEALMKPLAKTIVNACDEIIAVSAVPARYIKKLYKGEINIVPNGINLDRFHPDLRPFEKYRDGKINILFLGRLDKRKGVRYLLKAYRSLRGKYSDIRLIIAGSGSEEEKIRKYVKKNGLKDLELLGFVEEEDKPRLYATCDIFCSPALYGESFGMVLVEAMACGKPVVAYANDGYKCVLKGKGALLLCEPKDVGALADKIEILYSDEKFRNDMSEWGIEEAQKYSWENICNQVLTVYDKAIERNRRLKDTEKIKKSLIQKAEEFYKKLNGSLSKTK